MFFMVKFAIPCRAADTVTPADMQASAYMLLEQGDSALADQNVQEAAQSYQAAWDAYRTLSQSFPQWQVDIITYRMSYCKNRLQELDAHGDTGDYQAMKEELDALRKRLAGSEEQSAKMKERVIKLAVVINRYKEALSRIEALEAENTKLKSSLVEMEAIAEKSREEDQERLKRVREENEGLMKQVDVLNAELRKSEKARINMSNVLARGSQMSSQELLKRAKKAEVQERYEEALDLYETLLATGNGHGDIVFGKARCLLHGAQPQSVLDTLQSNYSFSLEEKEKAMLMAMSYCQLERYVDAIVLLRPLEKRNAHDAEFLGILGAAFLGDGRFDHAQAVLMRAVTLKPDMMDAHYNLAQAYYFDRPGDLKRAREHYERYRSLGGEADEALERSL